MAEGAEQKNITVVTCNFQIKMKVQNVFGLNKAVI